jgi:DNA helicase HerA-like ATPase
LPSRQPLPDRTSSFSPRWRIVAGSLTPKLAERPKTIHANPPDWRGNAAAFWDVFGRRGFSVRATVSDFGPLLLSRQRRLNATQEGVLALVFKIADDSGLLLLDLKNLRAMLQFVGDNSRQFTTQYGNVSAASIGAIQRGVARDRAAGWQSILRRADDRHQ